MSEKDFRDSASVPLDDIETIKRRQLENFQALEEAKEALVRTNVRLDKSDLGQLEILRILREQGDALVAQGKVQADQTEALKKNTEVTEQIRDLFTFGKVSTKFVVWAGTISGAVGGFIYFWSAWIRK